MAAKYILAALSAVFLSIAAVRILREGGRIGPAPRTWVIIGVIFGVVSGWLWYSA